MARVSIGLPVFNGAEMVADALANLAGQTFTDFEVVVSDNASTDDTAAIVERFAARDPRFRLIRQPGNIGAFENFRAVAEAATSELFLWRAHDDLTTPNYIAALLALIEDGAELAVARRDQLRIGRARRRFALVPPEICGVGQRAPEMLLRRSHAGWFYGMTRTAAARRTIAAVQAGYDALWAWDHLMIFPAILSGRVAGTNDAVFFHRLSTKPETARPPRDDSTLGTLRARYVEFCKAQIAAADLDDDAALALRRAVTGHARWII